jgi:hypothetical protein
MASSVRKLLPAWLLPCALLAACGTYGPGALKPGDDVAAVQHELGPPTHRYPLAEGRTRLEFARGPFGKHTYMVDMDDATQRVAAINQVLDDAHFNQVRAGMPRAELLRLLGRPAETRGGGWQPGEVWSWRYETPFCDWFQVSLDPQGRVIDSAHGPDPLCDRRDARGD